MRVVEIYSVGFGWHDRKEFSYVKGESVLWTLQPGLLTSQFQILPITSGRFPGCVTASVHLRETVFTLLVNLPIISELLVNYKQGTCLHQPPVRVSRTILRECMLLFWFCFPPSLFTKNDEISYQAVEHGHFTPRSAVTGLCSRVTSINTSPISLSPGRTNCSVMIQNGHLFHILFPFWLQLIIYSEDSSQNTLNSKIPANLLQV